MLDARGAISVTERTGYIKRVRRLARASAVGYLKMREEMDYPLLKGGQPSAAGSQPGPGKEPG